MPRKILVASYTSNITTISFDPSASPPSLSLVSTLEVGHHPSWITPHSTDKSLVFAVVEQADGKVKALKYDLDSGVGEVVGECSSGGAEPAHASVVGDELIVGNYTGGSVSVIPLLSTRPHLPAEPAQILVFTGSGPVSSRQAGPHPHQVVPHPTRIEVLVPDLGSDKTWRLLRSSGYWETKGCIDMQIGTGPRHAVVLGDTLYTVLELNNMLTSHRIPPLPAAPTRLHSTPTLLNPPENPTEIDPPPLSAEILSPRISESFPTPYLYVSNRNDPSPEGDIIAIFEVDEAGGPARLIRQVRTGLNHLRGIAFDETGRWLLAGGVFGGGVKVYERVEGGRGLKEVAHLEEVDRPTGFHWLPAS